MNLKGVKILFGITGAIAAYKVLELIRLYRRGGAEVKVVVTPNALEFVTVKTLETLSLNEVYVKQFEKSDKTVHISLSEWADVFVIAPLSANTLSKFAMGIADNLLTSIFTAELKSTKPIILAPSMNDGMWANPFVQENIAKLKFEGCHIIEPEEGFLACEMYGKGRLANINDIYDKTLQIITKNLPLSGKRIIVTAGGTKEYIDPVRYITNASSGKMGIALADEAYKLGADVQLICTFEVEKDYNTILAQSAEEMLSAVEQEFDYADCLIMAAAVADYRIKEFSDQKISSGKDNMTLELVKNEDILKTICAQKRHDQKVIGFCLATENLLECAKDKLQKKNCDFIIANEAKTALNQDTNEVWVIGKDLEANKINLDTKNNIAKKILELIYD